MAERVSVDVGLMQQVINLIGNMPARITGGLLMALEADAKALQGEQQEPTLREPGLVTPGPCNCQHAPCEHTKPPA